MGRKDRHYKKHNKKKHHKRHHKKNKDLYFSTGNKLTKSPDSTGIKNFENYARNMTGFNSSAGSYNHSQIPTMKPGNNDVIVMEITDVGENQIFIPPGTKLIRVTAYGGGGGGGGGGTKSPDGQIKLGGPGGSSAAIVNYIIKPIDETDITVEIGAGGNGGKRANGTGIGGDGQVGGNTIITIGSRQIIAYGGGPGQGSQQSSNGLGGGGGGSNGPGQIGAGGPADFASFSNGGIFGAQGGKPSQEGTVSGFSVSGSGAFANHVLGIKSFENEGAGFGGSCIIPNSGAGGSSGAEAGGDGQDGTAIIEFVVDV